MTPDAILIQQPAIDFGHFLSISNDALGYSPAAASDASPRQQSDAERFLSCLAAMQDEKAAAGMVPTLLNHVSFSALIVADERDLLGIIQAGGGIPFVHSETVRRGVLIAVMTGTLSQWRDAVKTGTNPANDQNIRACYSKLLTLFEQSGLNVWQDFHHKTTPDRLLYLEHK